MAFPVVLVDSASGSDTQASGAGPSTALFGTTDASTDGTGTTVTLTAGTDLTNVATDGSHVIFLNDSTAGARNFGKITGKAGSGGATPTVTVSNAFGLSLTGKSWAIGGRRASIGSTTSRKLRDNNAGNGDAMPGWTLRLMSGHAETLTIALDLRRSGDTTDGWIMLEGESDANGQPTWAVRPVLNFSGDVNGVVIRGLGSPVRNFQIHSTGVKTSKYGLTASGIVSFNAQGMVVSSSNTSNKWTAGIAPAGIAAVITDCEVSDCQDGILHGAGGNNGGIRITGCDIHDNTNIGIRLDATAYFGIIITDNILYNNGASNIEINNTRTDSLGLGTYIARNTIYGKGGSGGDGLKVINWNESIQAVIESNWFVNCLYGIRYSNGSASVAGLRYYGAVIRNNGFYNNTSGKYLPTGLDSYDEVTTNPDFTNASLRNFTQGIAGKEKGYPMRNIGGGSSATRSYVDIGAQRQEPAGGGGLAWPVSGRVVA